jgi:hypothetical protein
VAPPPVDLAPQATLPAALEDQASDIDVDLPDAAALEQLQATPKAPRLFALSVQSAPALSTLGPAEAVRALRIGELAAPSAPGRDAIETNLQALNPTPITFRLNLPVATFLASSPQTEPEPEQPSAPAPAESSTPPLLAMAAGSFGLHSSPGSSMLVLSTGLLLAATWRTLSLAARSRPLGISLPELAPPG